MSEIKMLDEIELARSREATREHIANVAKFMMHMASELLRRASVHDASKLPSPEVETFAVYTAKLKDSTYGSEEYNQFLKDMKPALDHHYANNSHHPEHYPNGVDGMNLLDLVEMFCDWKAAGMRHADGSLKASIEKNTGRFKLSPQMVSILMNSIDLFDPIKSDTPNDGRVENVANVIGVNHGSINQSMTFN